MKFKALILLAFSSLAINAMDKPSWAQALWQSTKNKIASLPLIKPIIKDYKRHQQLYDEVEAIVKNGSTVQEAEAKRIKARRIKILEDFKKCACLSDQELNHFFQEIQKSKENNPLFLNKKEHEEILEVPTDYITHSFRKKMIERNLNPHAVNLVFCNDFEVAAAGQIGYKKFVSNFVYFNTSHPQRFWNIDKTFHHEITHLEEHHPLQGQLLTKISSNSSQCLKPFRHHIELEADMLYALQNYRHAIDVRNYHCVPYAPWLFEKDKASETHPSHHTYCKCIKRIITMLEIEKTLKEKHAIPYNTYGMFNKK